MSTNVKQLTIHNTASIFRNINNVIIVPSKNKNLCQQSSKDCCFFFNGKTSLPIFQPEKQLPTFVMNF